MWSCVALATGSWHAACRPVQLTQWCCTQAQHSDACVLALQRSSTQACACSLTHGHVQVLSKELARWLADDVWQDWAASLGRLRYDEGQVADVLQQHAAWLASKQQSRDQ